MAFQPMKNRQQLNQARKLQQLELQGATALGDYNYGKQMQMWQDTNYPAQVEQMQKAGLNIGLMYGGSGQGGTTQSLGAGKVGGQGAGTASPMMGQVNPMLLEQMKNVKATTENVNADTKVKTAQKDNIEAQTKKTGHESESLRMSNWIQGIFQNDEQYLGHNEDGKRVYADEIWEKIESGELQNPAVKQRFLEMMKLDADRKNVLSKTEEQEMKNLAREMGVTDLDPMYIRLGARYAIEEGVDKNDARFAMAAAEAAVSIFEIFKNIKLKGIKPK